MRYLQLCRLSVLAAAPFSHLATPLAPPWDDMRVKLTWNTVPPNRETLGDPPAGTTTNLHAALKPQELPRRVCQSRRSYTLIDALYEDQNVPGTFAGFLNRVLRI